jgi:hypothetical protein
MNNANNRVLGRILAVEELNDVSGGWTLASAGDTTRSLDTGSIFDSGKFVDISTTMLDPAPESSLK